MIYNKAVLVVLIILSLGSCGFIVNDVIHDKRINFQIVNASGMAVSGVEIQCTYDADIKTTAFVVGSGKSAQTILDMSNAAEVDGSYSVRYSIGSISCEKKFGYYSNGTPLANDMVLEILDTGIRIHAGN